MPTDHFHLTAARSVKEGLFETRYIVRAESAEAELRLLREMGYTMRMEFCSDSDHLRPEQERRR